jgi:hypothetical protein
MNPYRKSYPYEIFRCRKWWIAKHLPYLN